MSYQITKDRQQVQMLLTTGEHMQGYVFLDSSDINPGETISVIDYMNDQELFFPFHMKNGSFLIVQKSSILTISLPVEAGLRFLKDPGPEAFIVSDVTVKLSQQQSIQGQVYVDPVEGFSRVTDQLKRTGRFLPLKSNDLAVLINTQHITTIAPSA